MVTHKGSKKSTHLKRKNSCVDHKRLSLGSAHEVLMHQMDLMLDQSREDELELLERQANELELELMKVGNQ